MLTEAKVNSATMIRNIPIKGYDRCLVCPMTVSGASEFLKSALGRGAIHGMTETENATLLGDVSRLDEVPGAYTYARSFSLAEKMCVL